MENIENILDVLGTIRRLERVQLSEPDPRVRQEIAETLDMLNPVFDRMVKKYADAVAQEKQKTAA